MVENQPVPPKSPIVFIKLHRFLSENIYAPARGTSLSQIKGAAIMIEILGWIFIEIIPKVMLVHC